MQPKSNIAAFFDFDETLVSVNSSKIGFKWLYAHGMLSKIFILKVMIAVLLNRKNIISEKHLEFYFKYMDLPEEIYNLYQDCDLREYKIKIYHYKTGD